MRIKLTIAYDGSNYFGFQHQDNVANIEDIVLKAINKIDNTVEKIYGSGRTDRYVHAKGQVIHFDTVKDIEGYKWVMAINTFLPDDIKVLEASVVSDEFHARYSAVKKEYRYYIRKNDYDLFSRNYSEYIPNLDIDLMKECLVKLEGKHDFKGFCSAKIAKEKSTVKEIFEAKLIEHKEYLELVFIGDGFLKYQIRTMIGTIVDIATKKKDIKIIDKIFEEKNPELTNRVVSGKGLYLIKVTY
jgi:tRNA pseudouridine38-40 synthase